MKYKLVVLVLFLTFTQSFSQVRVGLIGGLNFSDITDPDFGFSEFTHVNSFEFGAAADISFSDNFSIYLEPMYIEKGGAFKIEESIGKSILPDITLRMSYIEIPIFLKFSTGEKIKPFIIAGPTIDINLSSKIETGFQGFEFAIDTQDLTRRFGFGLSFGGGLNYMTDAITLLIECRYTLGISDFTKPGYLKADIAGNSFKEKISENPNLKTKGIQIMCGFLLPITN
ncbi:porin family protein [Bacteroidota bacterium]